MISMLLNKKFNNISRAVDMLCLFLGEDYSFISQNGQRIDVAEYSLHFQTQWRFREKNAILLASRDIYEPFDESISKDWEYDITGRPDELSSVFDVRAKQLRSTMEGTVVIKCLLTATNDIILEFSNGVVFEQFTPASRKDEEWRIIDYINDTHIVCYDEEGNISHE